jgi:hypothetical protein
LIEPATIMRCHGADQHQQQTPHRRLRFACEILPPDDGGIAIEWADLDRVATAASHLGINGRRSRSLKRGIFTRRAKIRAWRPDSISTFELDAMDALIAQIQVDAPSKRASSPLATSAVDADLRNISGMEAELANSRALIHW